ncbi:MAG: hypothetical protein ACJA0U_001860 [Salibacteraceae bacterium]|jgi:hypothetical protein
MSTSSTITPDQMKDLKKHLQTAVDVELSTIPIYLYTYYSILRVPTDTKGLSEDKVVELTTFANKLGGIVMSVAVEEMLHLSLSSNILRALGGEPQIYGRSPGSYPTNLEHHSSGFSVGLCKMSIEQLDKFIAIEKPAPAKEDAQKDNWDTLGQFYEYIQTLVEKTGERDYSNHESQLSPGKGYYAVNNVDTIYPKSANYVEGTVDKNDPSKRDADAAVYPNNDDSGGLIQIRTKADAIKAIKEISEQGEGFRDSTTHKEDNKYNDEDSHWYKFKALHDDFVKLDLDEADKKRFIFQSPDNPVTSKYPEKYQSIVKLSDAVYSYLLWMTQKSFELQGHAQSSMFYIGMHKGMIFILDKILGDMRYNTYTDAQGKTCNLAPSFENYMFAGEASAKNELVKLAKDAHTAGLLSPVILERIQDLPDVHVVDNKVSFA